MKTKKLIATAGIIAVSVFSFTVLQAQSWSITGNANIAAGTNYLGTSDPNDLVFRTNALERGRVFGSGGAWRFGNATNNAQVDSLGVLTFKGTGVYQVAGNKYAFQYKNNPNYGLFFNSTNVRYEFRTSNADPLFYIDANNGTVSIGNPNAGNNYLLPQTRGTANQILKTDGSGNVAWLPDENTTYTAGTGISIASTVITNSAPDKIVALTGTNGITTSGTYPNFSISGNNLWSTAGNAGTTAATNFIGTTDLQGLAFRTNNVERMRIISGGNIGIGTVSPTASLHINSASGSDALRVQTNGTTRLFIDDAGGVTVGSTTAGPTGGLFVSGNVGIGVSSPTTKLDVNGNTHISGNMDATGTVGFGSVETFSDGGFNTIASNSSIIPTLDNARALGTSSFRWTEVWATDGTINTSDLRDKTNVRDLNYGLKEIMQLHSVKFNWKDAHSKEDKIGVIAQEIQKVMPEVVRDYEYKTDESTGTTTKVASSRLGVMYSDIIPVLIKAIQEQQKEIEQLKNNAANSTTATNAASVSEINAVNVKISTAALDQNIPNPLRNTTSIRYTVPTDAGNAMLIITDMNGKSIKQISLKPGAGIVNIDASSLNAGTYNYTLVIDGRNIDSKKMVVAK